MAKFCISCGAQLEDEQAFCPNCGAPQDNSQAAEANATETTSATEPVNVAPQTNSSVQPKSKMVAGLLGIFLGGWGVHNFYLGNNSRGIIQIVVTLLTCGAGALWGLIEGILILCGNINTDADGNPLGD